MELVNNVSKWKKRGSRMKRMVAMMTIVIMMIIFTGCGADADVEVNYTSSTKNEGVLQIAVTNFSEYEWVREILGTNIKQVELIQIIDSGVDLHRLIELDEKYQEVVKLADKETVLFGDRFPFRYLVDDYELTYVLTTETGHKIANTIVENTVMKDQEIIAMNSMQSTSSTSEKTYLEIMEENLEIVKKVLN